MTSTRARLLPTNESDTLLAELTLSRAVVVQLAVVGALGFYVSLVAFTGLYDALVNGSLASAEQFTRFDQSDGVFELLVLLLLTISIIIPHELLHGLAIRYFGGTPRYGVGLAHFILPYAYATTDHRFTRNQFIVVALAPLVVLTLVGVALMTVFECPWLIIPLAANAGGAIGDCWMVLTLLGYPAHARVRDNATGVQILGHSDDHPCEHWLTAAIWSVLIGAAAVPIVIYLFVPWVLLEFGIEALTVGQPGTITLLFALTNTATSYSFAVGSGSLLLGAGFGLLYGFIRHR